MLVNGQHYRTIWLDEEDPYIVRIIDYPCLQTRLRTRVYLNLLTTFA